MVVTPLSLSDTDSVCERVCDASQIHSFTHTIHLYAHFWCCSKSSILKLSLEPPCSCCFQTKRDQIGSILTLFEGHRVHGWDHSYDAMSKLQSQHYKITLSTLFYVVKFSLTLCLTHTFIFSIVAAKCNDTLESHQLSGKINSSDWRAH